jgi:arsenate reductase-like glutaredoxin family protein
MINEKDEEKITSLAEIFFNVSEDPIIREILISVFSESNTYVEEVLAQQGKEKLTLYCQEQNLSIPPEISFRLNKKYDDIIRMIFIEIISNKKVDVCYKDMHHKSDLKQLLIRYIIEEFPHLLLPTTKNEDGNNLLN